MKAPIFGRKGEAQEDSPGHSAVLRTLRDKDREDPNIRLQLAGRVVFDQTYRTIAEDRGVRIEELLGILGSCGGFSCIVAALDILKQEGRAPEAAGMAVVKGSDGNVYYFGDLPNRFLLESQMSLLSLTLGVAHALGAKVSLEMIHDVMRHVAGSLGGPDFGSPRLPEAHRLWAHPAQYVEHLWPQTRDALNLYEVPLAARPTAIGFAIQLGIEQARDVLDPLVAAQIVAECAVPMAKLDPARFD